MRVAEVIVYESLPTRSERRFLNAYIRGKYGIASAKRKTTTTTLAALRRSWRKR